MPDPATAIPQDDLSPPDSAGMLPIPSDLPPTLPVDDVDTDDMSVQGGE